MNKNALRNNENGARTGPRKSPGDRGKNWAEAPGGVPRPLLAPRGVQVVYGVLLGLFGCVFGCCWEGILKDIVSTFDLTPG